MQAKQLRAKIDDPARPAGKEEKTEKSQPDNGDDVEGPYQKIVMAKGQHRSADKTHRKQSYQQPQLPGRSRQSEKGGPGLIQKQMAQKQDRLNDGNKNQESAWHLYKPHEREIFSIGWMKFD